MLQWQLVFAQGMQLVNGLVLMSPLQVQLDFLHQRNTVRLSNVQFFCFGDAVLLHGIEEQKKKVFICIFFHLIHYPGEMEPQTSMLCGRRQENTLGMSQIITDKFMQCGLNTKVYAFFFCNFPKLCCTTSMT